MAGGEDRAVVVADDDAALRMLCRVNLEHEGYRVLEADCADELERVLASDDVSLVLLDIHLGADDGVAVARVLRSARPDVAIAFFTGSAPVLSAATLALADGVLPKPFSLEQLSETVRRLVPA